MSRAKNGDPQPPRMPDKRPGQTGGRRDQNRRARLRQLCDAAVELFLEDGIARVTIDRIVDRAGMAKGSFYRYFRDKTELCTTLLAPLEGRVMDAFSRCRQALAMARAPEDLVAAYLAMSREIAAVIVDNPQLSLLYLQESRAPKSGSRAPLVELSERIGDEAETLTEFAREHGLLRDLDPRVQGLVVVGAVERLLQELLRGGLSAAPQDIAATVVTIILDGVRFR
ncbi:MAG TPA: TetR/AcrR family transcriptional regulator [Kofleriaceae bacterium]|nr:TetR/AcrR family transcriptional regulator [Kofleriaceae bacterium]